MLDWVNARRTATRACAGICFFTLSVPAAQAAPADPGAKKNTDYAVAYQINPAHSGSITLKDFTTPLTKLWSVNLGTSLSYALVVENLVIVNGANDVTYALALASGTTKWSKTSGSSLVGLAYDNRSIFLVTGGGLMSRLSAKSGAQVWSVQLPDQYAFSSAPIAMDDQVFTGGAGDGGTLYAVSESSGAVQWTQSVQNGDNSSPAYGDHGIYVSYPCQYYKFNPSSGSQDWNYNGGCEGGGGNTPAYFGGNVYVQDWTSGNYVLNAATGAVTGTFGADNGLTPAFYGTTKKGYGFSLSQGTLYGWKTSTDTNIWTFTGDGQLSTAAIVINDMVVEGSQSGEVYALDAKSGQEMWSANSGAGVTSLSAGQNTLIVVSGNIVTAYGP